MRQSTNPDFSHFLSTSPLPSDQAFVLDKRAQKLNVGSDTNDTVLAVGVRDVVWVNDGSNNMITLSGKLETAALGTGSSSNLVIMNGAYDAVQVAGNNSVTAAGSAGHITLQPTFRADNALPLNVVTVTAEGSGHLGVSGTVGELDFQGADGSYDIDATGAARAIINGGQGGGTFIGGDFGYSYSVGTFHDGNNYITAGAQRSVLEGSAYGTSQLTAAGNGHDILIAGEYGQSTLSGGTSTGGNLMKGFLGAFTASTDYNAPSPSTVFVAGAGNDTLVAGAGASTLSGGGGQNMFEFIDAPNNAVAGGNTAVITDFSTGNDLINLHGFGETTHQILSEATYSSAGTTLHLDGGLTVTINGVHLTAADVIRTA